MRNLKPVSFVIISLLLLAGCQSPKNQSPQNTSKNDSTIQNAVVRVMTYNIKYDDQNDPVNGWDNRKNKVVGLLRFHQPDFVGTQEGLYHQLQYIKEHLHQYDFFGKGRDDGARKGEFSAILYNKNRFELLKDTTLWLSPTPTQPGKGWDAAYPRIITAGFLLDQTTNKHLWAFNTHFDHIGEEARRNSAILIHRFISEFANGQPYVLTGDFNVTPDAKPYSILTEPADSIQTTVPLLDTYKTTVSPHYGPVHTFVGFDVKQPERRIDYIFSSPDFMVLRHATLTDFNDMRFPSDHLPVVADMVLKR